MTTTIEAEYLTPHQTAEFIQVSTKTLAVWRSAQRYDLPYVRLGKLIRYRKSDLVKWLAKRSVKG